MRQTWPLLIVALGVAAAAAEPKPAPPKEEVFRGKVVPLTTVLKRLDIELDPDAAPFWLALEAEGGKVYPLIKDAGGRTFYHDKRLIGQTVQLRGRVIPGTQLMQVLQVFTLKNGKVHEAFYWCEVCAIKRYSLEPNGNCDCCGAPMEFREVPAGK